MVASTLAEFEVLSYRFNFYFFKRCYGINFQENLDCHAAQFDWHAVKWTLEFSKAACSEKNCLAG